MCRNEFLSFGTQFGVMFYKILINSVLCFLLCTSAFTQNQSPNEAALCFYNWYLQAIKGPANAHTAIVKKGPNGEAVLDYAQYFQNLDTLGCIADSFKLAEKMRFQSCQDYFKDTPFFEYYEYIDNYPNHYDIPCPFFTRYNWVGDIAQWQISGVEKTEGVNPAVVSLVLKSGSRLRTWKVSTVQDGERWKIVRIE